MQIKNKYISLKKATISKPDDFESWLDYGDFLLEEYNKPKEAIKAYEKAQELVPTGDFRLRMGDAYAKLGDYDKAIHLIKQSIEENPRVHAYVFLANVYLMMEDHKNAKLACEAALELDPEFEEAHYLLGEAEKNEKKAINHYQKAIELNSGYHLAWQALGKKYLILNKVQLAIEALEKSIELIPTDIWTRLYLANAFWRAGKIEEADQQYQVLIHQNPDDDQIRKWYAEFLKSKSE